MARTKKRQPSRPRSAAVLTLILHCKAKRWDARERRAKDARNDPRKEVW